MNYYPKPESFPVYDFRSPGSPVADEHLIPSEYLLGHLKRFLMIQLEALAMGMINVQRVKADLRGVNFFMICAGGVTANIACNEYLRVIDMPDDQLEKIAKKLFKR